VGEMAGVEERCLGCASCPYFVSAKGSGDTVGGSGVVLCCWLTCLHATQ
jgi:hypothetical protein